MTLLALVPSCTLPLTSLVPAAVHLLPLPRSARSSPSSPRSPRSPLHSRPALLLPLITGPLPLTVDQLTTAVRHQACRCRPSADCCCSSARQVAAAAAENLVWEKAARGAAPAAGSTLAGWVVGGRGRRGQLARPPQGASSTAATVAFLLSFSQFHRFDEPNHKFHFLGDYQRGGKSDNGSNEWRGVAEASRVCSVHPDPPSTRCPEVS